MEIKKLKVRKLSCCENKSRITVSFDIENEDEEWHEYLEQNIKENTWLLEHYAEFRPWDWSYNLRLFGNSLYETGLSIKQNDRLTKSQKYSRRAMYVGKRLEKISDSDVVPEHLSTMKYFEHIKYKWEPSGYVHDGDELMQMRKEYTKGNSMNMSREDYTEKMYKIANKRTQKIEESYYYDTMRDLTHQLRYFWD